MTANTCVLQMVLLTLEGWVSRHQQNVIEYLIEENRVLEGAAEGPGDAIERRSVSAACG